MIPHDSQSNRLKQYPLRFPGLGIATLVRVAILCLVFQAACATSVNAASPNILFVLADDLGIGDLSCYGNPYLETPQVDALAKAGARLTSHYAPAPLCAPSRAGYLTGRYNHRTGAVDVPSNRGLDRIALSEKTFADYFGELGYSTALIGKWHNGLYCKDYLPHHRGFDEFFGFANGGHDYWDWNLLRNDRLETGDGRYLTDVLNDEAMRFISDSKARGKPFALVLAHHAPHSPFQAPQSLVRKYQRKLEGNASDNVATIYAMIEAMDTGLGRVFSMLKENGLWEDTMIVFTSDNGASLSNAKGGATFRFHGGYSGNKGDVGEQGIRVPAVVHWPNQIPAGQVLNVPIHGCDWLPTLLSACEQHTFVSADKGRKAPLFDGVNILPTLQGESQSSLNARVLPFQKNRYRPAKHSDAAIRRGRWKLVWPGVPATMKKDGPRDNPSYLRGIVRPHWEMPLDRGLGPVPEFPEPKPRLFDLSSDRSESRDVSGTHPEVVQELRRSYDHWFDSVMADWRTSREEIIQHDRAYWRKRTAPNPRELFREFWLWSKVPDQDPKVADPLQVFQGYWDLNNQ